MRVCFISKVGSKHHLAAIGAPKLVFSHVCKPSSELLPGRLVIFLSDPAKNK